MSDIYDRRRQYEDRAKQLMKLCSIPERTTSEDLRQAATALDQASRDIKQLMNTQPHGCTCRYMEDDGRNWVIYDEQCQHHRWMNSEIKRASDAYAEARKKLEDAVRIRFFEAAIQGLCASRTEPATPEVLMDRAMAFADAAVARLKK